jgi:hypothetical protein
LVISGQVAESHPRIHPHLFDPVHRAHAVALMPCGCREAGRTTPSSREQTSEKQLLSSRTEWPATVFLAQRRRWERVVDGLGKCGASRYWPLQLKRSPGVAFALDIIAEMHHRGTKAMASRETPHIARVLHDSVCPPPRHSLCTLALSLSRALAPSPAACRSAAFRARKFLKQFFAQNWKNCS